MSALSLNAGLADADLPDEVAALKRRPGGDLVRFGGAGTVQAFVRQGLVDDHWFKVHPVAIGACLPVFTKLRAKTRLTLVQGTACASGVLTLRYRPV